MLTLPAYDPATLLHESEHARLYRSRQRHDGRAVVLKQLCRDDADSVARLHAEYNCLQGLRHAAIVRPLALLQHQQRWVMVLEDQGGLPLTQAPPWTTCTAPACCTAR